MSNAKIVYLRMKTLQERFEQKFIKGEPHECWIWTGAKKTGNYGTFWDGKQNSVASRKSYELYVGPITEGLWVCHTCDNPPCVNPNHLFLGTPAENKMDAVAKGRIKMQPCPSAVRYAKGCRCGPCRKLNSINYSAKHPKPVKFKNTQTGTTYTCVREIAEDIGIASWNIVYAIYKGTIPIIKC